MNKQMSKELWRFVLAYFASLKSADGANSALDDMLLPVLKMAHSLISYDYPNEESKETKELSEVKELPELKLMKEKSKEGGIPEPKLVKERSQEKGQETISRGLSEAVSRLELLDEEGSVSKDSRLSKLAIFVVQILSLKLQKTEDMTSKNMA